MKSNRPLEVAVSRGAFVESTHIVDAIVVDADGSAVECWGIGEREIFPRSSVKALQALLLIESGAADAFEFEAKHLALACASHHATAAHVEEVGTMLSKACMDPTCLECGPMLPNQPKDQAILVKNNVEPGAIHNTCSGKHAGFLATAKHLGMVPAGYVGIDHPLQREIARTMEATTGSSHTSDNCGIDGCSIPTYRVSMKNLASAYARFGVGEDLSPIRSKAMVRLRDACMDHPEMVAGPTGGCTRIMNALQNRAFVKFGAEGVYTCALPELGYGIVLKVRDGNIRAAEVAIAGIIERFLDLSESEAKGLAAVSNPTVRNANGTEVGKICAKFP